MKMLHDLAFPVSDIRAALDWYQSSSEVRTVYTGASQALLTHEDFSLLLVRPDILTAAGPSGCADDA